MGVFEKPGRIPDVSFMVCDPGQIGKKKFPFFEK
jgi:hypothetical protein